MQLPAQRLLVEDLDLVFERQRVLEIGIAVLPRNLHFYYPPRAPTDQTSSCGQYGNANAVAQHSRLVGFPGTPQGNRYGSLDRACVLGSNTDIELVLAGTDDVSSVIGYNHQIKSQR